MHQETTTKLHRVVILGSQVLSLPIHGCCNNCNFTGKLYFRGILGVNMKNQEPEGKIPKAGNRNRLYVGKGGCLAFLLMLL